MARASRSVSTPDSTAARMTIDGSFATPKVERNRASRVALPASWMVMRTAAAAAAKFAARRSEDRSVKQHQMRTSEAVSSLDVHGCSFLSRRDGGRDGKRPVQPGDGYSSTGRAVPL